LLPACGALNVDLRVTCAACPIRGSFRLGRKAGVKAEPCSRETKEPEPECPPRGVPGRSLFLPNLPSQGRILWFRDLRT